MALVASGTTRPGDAGGDRPTAIAGELFSTFVASTGERECGADELRLFSQIPEGSAMRTRAGRIPFERFVGWGYRDDEHPNWHVIKKGIQGAVYRVDRLQPTLDLLLHDGSVEHHEKVAMKVVLARTGQGDLSDEFRALAKLKHENVVSRVQHVQLIRQNAELTFPNFQPDNVSRLGMSLVWTPEWTPHIFRDTDVPCDSGPLSTYERNKSATRSCLSPISSDS